MVGELCGSRCRQILDDTTRFLILEKMSIVSFTQFEEVRTGPSFELIWNVDLVYPRRLHRVHCLST